MIFGWGHKYKYDCNFFRTKRIRFMNNDISMEGITSTEIKHKDFCPQD